MHGQPHIKSTSFAYTKLRYSASTETSVERQVLVNRVGIARTIFTACVKRVGFGVDFHLVIKVSDTYLPHPWNLTAAKAVDEPQCTTLCCMA